MPTLLSLTREQTDKTGWHKRDAGAYNSEYANAIEEPAGTQPDRMLAAIPSPFARLHVFDIAFRFLSDPKRSVVGDTVFHRAVSQALDALELLFHWNTHLASRFPLKVVRWDTQGELETLRAGRPEHKLLSDALSLYLHQDPVLAACAREMWMLTASEGEDRVLAVSSPLTLVAPAPGASELAKRLNLLVPSSDGGQGTRKEEARLYFSGTKSLVERGPEFRAYVEDLFAASSVLPDRCPQVFAYVQKIRRGSTDFTALVPFRNADYDDLTEGGSAVTMHARPMKCAKASPVPATIRASKRRIRSDRAAVSPQPIMLVDQYDSSGVHRANFRAPAGTLPPVAERQLPDFMCPYPFLVESDLFEDFIIKLPYPLNTEAFVLPKEAGKTETAFLPPLKPAYYSYFSEHQIASRVRYEVTPNAGGVRCLIEIPLQENSLQLQRTYYLQPAVGGAGRIIEADVTLAAFPSVRWREASKDDGDYQDEQMFALIEEPKVRGEPWRSELTLYNVSDAGTLVPAKGSALVVRERSPRTNVGFSSKYYTLTGASPDLIELAIDTDEGSKARSLLCFAARPVPAGARQFILAVDFGTTNSHVALAERQPQGALRHDLMPRGADSGMVAVTTLHAPGTSGIGFVANAEFAFRHEFVPTEIASTRLMPTRTAIAERPNSHAEHLFSDGNIAFFVYRSNIRSSQDERIHTHLKWAKESDRDTVKRIRLFLREILLLAKAQILLNSGDPSKTQLLWFWPLSFTHYLRSTFEKIWREEARRVLDIDPETAIQSLTESAAPYYYHEASARVVSMKPVLSIDIGGGSTDVVFFDNKVPKFGSSFNFAGNGLWGSGFARTNEKAQWNGVAVLSELLLQGIESKLESKRRNSLRAITDGFLQNPGLSSSEETVNLGFKTDEYTGFMDELRARPIVKLMVLLQYSAIVFHCAQMMRQLKLAKPELVSLSGNGSRALDILDVSIKKRDLAAHTAAIFTVVYSHWDALKTQDLSNAQGAVAGVRRLLGTAATTGIELLIAERLKEATCEGGIYWSTVTGFDRPDPVPYVLLDGAEGLHPRDKVPRYSEIDAARIEGTAREFRRFVALIGALAGSFDRFGLAETTVEDAMPMLWDGVEDAIATGLDRRKLNAEGPNERAVETMFFYPLVHKLWKLSHDVK